MKILNIFLLLKLLLEFNSIAYAASQSCPVPTTQYFFGGGSGINTPSSGGPYETAQAVYDATIKASSEFRTYELSDASYEYRHYYIVHSWKDGIEIQDTAQIGVDVGFACPLGFRLVSGDTSDRTCVNSETSTCDCPAGKKFKPIANMCVAVTPTSPDADPDDDNGPNCPGGAGEPEQPVCGNPVNPGSGNKIQIEPDFMDGGDGGLSIIRVYNSSPTQNDKNIGKLGSNWSFSYDRKVTLFTSRPVLSCYLWADDNTKFCEVAALEDGGASNSKTVVAFRPDGKNRYFTQSLSDNSIVKDSYINDELSYSPVYRTDTGNIYLGGAYTYISNGRLQKEVFSENYGRLIAIFDKKGTNRRITNFWGYHDSSVDRWPSDAPICNHIQPGPTIYGDRILCVTDNWGRQLNFEYESLRDSNTTSNPQVRITKIFDPAGKAYLYAYDGPSGGCNSPGGTSPACTANNLTSVTYPDGHSRVYHYNEAAQINGGKDCNQYVSVGNGFGGLLNSLTGITDENGVRFATWTYDCNGRATSSQHAGGVEKVDVSYSDVSNNGTGTRIVTNYTGDPASPTASTHTYTYQLVNGVPVLISTDKPCINCGNVASRSYDVNGNTAAYTDWNGNKTTFVFDLSRNLETSRTEAAGTTYARTISTAWHAIFRLPLKIAEPKRLTTFTYDSNGNLLTRTIQATTDLSGTSAFDAVTTGSARTWTYTYNEIGQVLTVTGPRTDVVDVTRFTYDANGNLATLTNALNQVTTFSNYDANRHVGQISEPNGVITTMTYTPRGWPSSRTITAGGVDQTTSYSYDGVGQLTGITQPDGSMITYNYDDAHRLSSILDGKGNQITYGYDVMSNRMTESVRDLQGALRRQVTRNYDILNRLHQITGGEQ